MRVNAIPFDLVKQAACELVKFIVRVISMLWLNRIQELERDLSASRETGARVSKRNSKLESELADAQKMFKDVAEIQVYLKALREHGVIDI